MESYRQSTTDYERIYEQQLLTYLDKISDEKLYAYNVYQIEGPGRNLFEKIEGDQNTIMGLPILMLKNYLRDFKC